MRYLGGFMIVFAAFFAWRIYSGYLREELGVTKAFLRALKDYRDKIKCYLVSPADWARDYAEKSDLLSSFLSRISDGEGMAVAYGETRSSYCLPSDVDESLCECFSSLGEGYLGVELAILDTAIGRIEEAEARLSDGLSKREKGVGALLGACAVGTVILII